MLSARAIVFLLDVDNTLLDNDRFGVDLGARIEQAFGARQRQRYWEIYARLRGQLGYADYLAALQEFRLALDGEPELGRIAAFVLDYPFFERLYPRALEAVAHLGALGLPVVLSDGDAVLQPRKIEHSGIGAAVAGRVMIYLHKEHALEPMQRRYPAPHYVMIDDKPLLLAAMKRAMGEKLTTVFVRQGHYATEAAGAAIDPAPDLCIDRIAQLNDFDASDFSGALGHAPRRNEEHV